jgi:hypothetical protein
MPTVRTLSNQRNDSWGVNISQLGNNTMEKNVLVVFIGDEVSAESEQQIGVPVASHPIK